MKIGKLFLPGMVLGLCLMSGIFATNINNLKGMYECFGDKYKELSILDGVGMWENAGIRNIYDYMSINEEVEEPVLPDNASDEARKEFAVKYKEWARGISSPVTRLVRGIFSYAAGRRVVSDFRVSTLISDKLTKEEFVEKIADIVAHLWWLKHNVSNENRIAWIKAYEDFLNFGKDKQKNKIGPNDLLKTSDALLQKDDFFGNDMIDGIRIVFLAALWQVYGTDYQALKHYAITVAKVLQGLDPSLTNVVDVSKLTEPFTSVSIKDIKTEMTGIALDTALTSTQVETMALVSLLPGSFPPVVAQKYAVPYEGAKFPDCMEHALRLFFNHLVYDPQTYSFDVKQLKDMIEKAKAPSSSPVHELLEKFYADHSLASEIGKDEVHAAWAKVVSNLPFIAYNKAIFPSNVPKEDKKHNGFIHIPAEYNNNEDLKKYLEEKQYTVVDDDVKLFELLPTTRNLIMLVDTLCNLGYQQDLHNTFTSATFIKDNLKKVFTPFGEIAPSVEDDIDDFDNGSGTIKHTIALKNLIDRDSYQVTMTLILRRHGELSSPESEAPSYPWFTSKSLFLEGAGMPLVFPMLTSLRQGSVAYQEVGASQIKQLLWLLSMPLFDHNRVAEIVGKVDKINHNGHFRILKKATIINNQEECLKQERLLNIYQKGFVVLSTEKNFSNAVKVATDACIDGSKHLYKGGIRLFKELLKMNKGIPQAIKVAEDAVISADKDIKDSGFDLFKELIAQNKGIPQAIKVAEDAVGNKNRNIRDKGIDLLVALIEQNRETSQAIAIAERAFVSNNEYMRDKGYKFFVELIEQNKEISQVIVIAERACLSNNNYIRKQGLELFYNLIKQQQGITEAIRVAEDAVENKDENIRDKGYDLFVALIKQNQGITEAIRVAEDAVENKDENIRDKGYDLFEELIKQNQGISQAITVAERAFVSDDKDRRGDGYGLFKKLIEYGHGIINIAEVVRKAVSSGKLEDINYGVSLFKLIAEKDTTYTAEYEDFKKVLTEKKAKVLTEKKTVVQKKVHKRRR